jgi:predicted flap endonuclease-1-like 5' DNA nuclease
MPTIADIEGIGEVSAVKLRSAGVYTTAALLERGRTQQGRRELAKMTGFSEKVILEWVNRADMFRIRGIGAQYSDLLEAAGIDTVRELATRKADALTEILKKVNAEKNKVNKLPGLNKVKDWIRIAKSLPRGVEY